MSIKKSYYGVFFWLTLITFAVPLFVAYRAFDQFTPTTKPVPQPDVSGVDHNLWDYLLKSYVENGLIDYEGIGKDYLFKVYLQQLAQANPDALSTPEEKLALLCNAYNALVVQGVVNHRIRTSVQDFEFEGTDFFNLREHLFANQTCSLNQLEHEIIRPKFREPRIHMALVCAAKSCPAIRTEAYQGERIEKQLSDQASLFCNSRDHVDYDSKSGRVRVNSILKWYGEDFDAVGGYLNWIAERIDDEELRAKILAAQRGEIKVGFIRYDWSLNAQQAPNSYRPRQPVAGSGTIPNA